MAFQREKIKPKLAALADKGVYVGTSSWKYQGWLNKMPNAVWSLLGGFTSVLSTLKSGLTEPIPPTRMACQSTLCIEENNFYFGSGPFFSTQSPRSPRSFVGRGARTAESFRSPDDELPSLVAWWKPIKAQKSAYRLAKHMKTRLISLLLLVATSLSLCGCVAVSYHKEVVTTLDSNGKVVSTVITESITEPHQETPRITSPQTVDLKHITQ
jgi:hypothetical protein